MSVAIMGAVFGGAFGVLATALYYSTNLSIAKSRIKKLEKQVSLRQSGELTS